MSRLASMIVLSAAVLLIFSPPAQAGWWHRRCCLSQTGAGSSTAFGATAGPTSNAQGLAGVGAGDLVGNLLMEIVRRQIANLPNLPLAPSGGQGVENQLQAINTTLGTMNTKLDTIADAIRKKEAIRPPPVDNTVPNNSNDPNRPLTPPPLGAANPGNTNGDPLLAMEERLGSKIKEINNRLSTMQGEIDGLKHGPTSGTVTSGAPGASLVPKDSPKAADKSK
jgi:hypothetical protein